MRSIRFFSVVAWISLFSLTMAGEAAGGWLSFPKPSQLLPSSVCVVGECLQRRTPSDCKDYQYAFISNKDGADNVYLVPCSDDLSAQPAVKLTNNTDPNVRYNRVVISSSGVLLYEMSHPYGVSIVSDKSVVDEPEAFLEGSQSYWMASPRFWWDGQAYVQINPTQPPEWRIIWNSDTMGTIQWPDIGDPAPQQIGSIDVANAFKWPRPWLTIASMLQDGNSSLFSFNPGAAPKVIEYPSGDPVKGTDPDLSPDNMKLAFVDDNQIKVCDLDTKTSDTTAFLCNGVKTLAGSTNLPSSAPCWSESGRYIYFQANYLTVDFIGRVDTTDPSDPPQMVLLDEFPGSAAYSGEKRPGCYPLFSPPQ